MPNIKSRPPTIRRSGVRERRVIAGPTAATTMTSITKCRSDAGQGGAPPPCHPHGENDGQRLDHLDGSGEYDRQNQEGLVLHVPTLSQDVVFATYGYTF